MSAASAPGRVSSGDGLDSPDGQGGSVRLYAGLLWLYPGEFRRRYAEEMVRLFADQLRDARASDRSGGTRAIWIRSLIDLVANAIGEHLRKDRTMAQSLATFEPTRSMRLLGALGLVGAFLLLWAFISFNPFEDRIANSIRLIAFSLGGSAIALAFYRRHAAGAPLLALATTGAVVISGVWNAAIVILSFGVPNPFSGTYGLIGFFAAIALWGSAMVYGIAVLRMGVAWRGMTRGFAVAVKVGAASLAVGSPLGILGIDRMNLVQSEPFGPTIQSIALFGIGLNGLGWVLLGAVLALGGRKAGGGAQLA
jgi:hypothetical protein